MGVFVAAPFTGAPAGLLENFNQLLGVSFKIGDTVVTPIMSIALLVGSGVIFLGLSILNLSRKRK